MTNKITLAAMKAKELGYENIASVIKQIYNTTYYHVVSVDEVIRLGSWPKAPTVYGMPGKKGSSWHGPVGVSTLPESTILRTQAMRLVD